MSPLSVPTFLECATQENKTPISCPCFLEGDRRSAFSCLDSSRFSLDQAGKYINKLPWCCKGGKITTLGSTVLNKSLPWDLVVLDFQAALAVPSHPVHKKQVRCHTLEVGKYISTKCTCLKPLLSITLIYHTNTNICTILTGLSE